MTVAITTTRKRAIPQKMVRLLSLLATKILGDTYTLSVVFIGNARSQTLNTTYRQKNYPTNVLAFPLSDTEGEIFINTEKAQREARHFSHTPETHIVYLFIHGCLHLKGFTHGDAMEQEEQKYFTQALATFTTKPHRV